jgi:hypothetical protein
VPPAGSFGESSDHHNRAVGNLRETIEKGAGPVEAMQHGGRLSNRNAARMPVAN